MSSITFTTKPRTTGKPLSFSHRETPKPQPDEASSEPKERYVPLKDHLKSETAQSASYVETTTPSTSSSPSLSLSNLTAAQNSALALLPAPAAASLKEVWSVLDGAEQSRSQLLDLLAEGTLASDDGEATVVERLHSLTKTQRAQGYNGASLTKQTIALLADPEHSVFQGDRRTCGAANLQCQLTESPALLAKIVDELSDPEGSLNLSPELKIERPAFVQADDGSGRSEMNRLLQGSLMALAGHDNGLYDVFSDRFVNGQDSLKSRQIARATAVLKNQDQAVVLHDSGTHAVFEKLFRSMPEGQSFQIGASWDSQDHMLLCLGQKDGQARYFNAQESKTLSMSVEDLMFKTQLAIFPADHVAGHELPEDALYYIRVGGEE